MTHKGYKATPEARENNRLARLGNKNSLGYKHTEEHKRKVSIALKGIPHLWQRGENHPKWKGDNITINSLHHWLRRHLPKPELCEFCNIKPPYDMACVTGVYNRDFSNWKYICRKCHLYYDGHIKNLELGRHNSYKVAREITDK